MSDRGFFNHIWYKLLDEEGVPISGATVWLYDSNLNPLITYESNVTSAASASQLSTDEQGIFEFYVQDDIGVPSGNSGHYSWDDNFRISWLKDDKSGILDGDRLFGAYAQVNENDTNTRINKSISNYLGYVFQNHIDSQFGSTDRCGSSSSSSSSISSSSESSSSFSISSSSSSSSESSSSTSSSSAFCSGGNLAALFEPDNYWRLGNYNIRNVIPASFLSQSGSEIRIIMESMPTTLIGCTITSMWVGHAAASGSDDFDGNQQQVFVSGSSTFAIPDNSQVTSDPVTITFDQNTDFIVSMFIAPNVDLTRAADETGAVFYIYSGPTDRSGDTTAPAVNGTYNDYVAVCTGICVTGV